MNDPAKILIVEDESIVAFNLQQRLELMGYEVAGVADTGAESLALVAEHKPDLVLMDIHIKGEMDGIEVASRLSQNASVPVVYLTAYSEDTTLERARRTRPYGYLIKPFSERELHATIQMALERHQVQEALSASQRLLQQALKAATMGTVQLSIKADQLRVSGPPAALLNLPNGEPVSLAHGLAMVNENDLPGLLTRVRTDQSGSFSHEFRVQVGESGERWLKMDASYLEDGLISGVLQDVTERKQMELRQLRQNEELEMRVQERTLELRQSLKELEAFNHTVAHDLRSPIRAISGLSHILIEEHGPALPDDAKLTLQRMGASATRMGMLIDALLNMTKLSRQALQLVPVDLSQIAGELVPLLRESDPLRQAEFHIEPALTAQADPVLIRSVLDNLLRNAWKFSARRPLTRITVGRCEHNGKLAFFVQDNGCGFSQEHAQRLFNPFFRLHSDREYSGTGLGLSIVERIVNRHGGQVWADAVPDQGATFYFTLGA